VRVGGGIVLAWWLASLPACDPCGLKGTDPTYSTTAAVSGDVSELPDVGLPKTLASARASACEQTTELCLMMPSGCHGHSSGCVMFELASSAPSGPTLDVQLQGFTFDAPAVALGSSDATATVSLAGVFRNGNIPVTGTLAGGSIASSLSQDELDVAFILDVVTSDGEHIKIPDGLAIVRGHAGTQCHAD
jgi:hypothetical protein